MSEILQNWISEHYDIDESVFIKALEQSPSAQGYIHGAVSEILQKIVTRKLPYL